MSSDGMKKAGFAGFNCGMMGSLISAV